MDGGTNLSWLCWPHPDGFLQVNPGYAGRTLKGSSRLKVLVVCLAGCAVVSVFGSGDYDQKKKVLVVRLAGCAIVSVFGSGGK